MLRNLLAEIPSFYIPVPALVLLSPPCSNFQTPINTLLSTSYSVPFIIQLENLGSYYTI